MNQTIQELFYDISCLMWIISPQSLLFVVIISKESYLPGSFSVYYATTFSVIDEVYLDRRHIKKIKTNQHNKSNKLALIKHIKMRMQTSFTTAESTGCYQKAFWWIKNRLWMSSATIQLIISLLFFPRFNSWSFEQRDNCGRIYKGALQISWRLLTWQRVTIF